MFTEAEHQRRDETAQAAQFLHARIQELEASLVAQRIALEQSKQRELALHKTIEGLAQLVESKHSRIESLEAANRNLERANGNLSQQVRSLAEEADGLHRRLRGSIAQTVASSDSVSGYQKNESDSATQESLFHEAVELRQRLELKCREADCVIAALNALVELPAHTIRSTNEERGIAVQRVADLIVSALETRRLSSIEIEEGTVRSLPSFAVKGIRLMGASASSPGKV